MTFVLIGALRVKEQWYSIKQNKGRDGLLYILRGHR